MRTEYKRDMNHNYLILTGDERIDTDSYQVRMIVANAVPDLLQCRIQGIDGKFMVYYDITSRHSMTALFEEKKMDLESLQMILGGFIQIMEEMSEYLLNPCQLILEPEYIYLDAERKSVRFCYMPGFHGEVQKQFQSLAEYILPKLDHEDGKAVMLGYSVYRRALEDSFHLEYIKEELYKICNSDEEDFSPYEKKKTVVQEDRMTEEDKEDNLWQMENWERASVSGNEKQKKVSADSQKRKTNKIWKPVAGFGAALVLLLGITAGMAGGYIPRISKEIFLLGILAAMILGMLSYILINKVCGKKKKLDTPVPEQKYGAAEKETAVYSEDQKESGALSGSNSGDSRTGKDQKKHPDKSGGFFRWIWGNSSSFGRCIQRSCYISEPGTGGIGYHLFGKRYHSDRKTGNCGGCSDQYTNCQQDPCQDPKKGGGILSGRSELQKWDFCKWTASENRRRLFVGG